MLDKHADTVGDHIKKEYKFISDLKGDLSLVIDTWRQSEYIINKTYIRNKQYVQLIPKKVDNLAHHIFKYADSIILMSATFVDYRSIMRNLGVAENDYKYIDLPSSFDPRKSPILFGNFHLNKKNLEYNFPKIVSCVEEILQEHSDVKGLIHTQSNVITKMLKDKIDSDRILYAQHGINEIRIGYPGEENLLLFNNMNIPGQQGGSSIVIEFRPPDDYYIEDGEAWGPTEPIWTFEDDFYGAKQSGAFRLPNGNTFVTVSGDDGMFEVTDDGMVVWEHSPPGVFRAQKYSSDYLTLFGDINGDGSVNVMDIVLLVNYILNDLYITEGDINDDGTLNILDIVTLTTIILGG